jgi:protein SCO1/2
MRRRYLIILVAASVLAALAGAGAAYLVSASRYRPTIEIPGDKALPDFTLVDQYGSEFTLSSVKGKVVLIYFGYTHCPDVCPLVMTKYKRLLEMLGPDADRVALIFITVDPERDTWEIMEKYVGYYSRHIIGLTGDPARVYEVMNKFGVTAAKVPRDEGGDYLVDHYALVLGADRNHILRIAFTPDMDFQEYLNGVRYLLSR